MSVHLALRAALPRTAAGVQDLPDLQTQPGLRVRAEDPSQLGPETTVKDTRAAVQRRESGPGVEPLRADNYERTQELHDLQDLTKLADRPAMNDVEHAPAFTWINRDPLQLPAYRKLIGTDDQAHVLRKKEVVSKVPAYLQQGSVERITTAKPTPGRQIIVGMQGV
jgi:hypothetical protein